MSWQQKLPGKWPKKVYFRVENLPCPFGPEPNFKLHIHHSAYGPWAQSTQYKRLYLVKIRNQNDMIITISTEKVFMFISFLLLLLLLVGVFISSFGRCCTQNNKQLFANEYKNMSLIFYVKCTRWEKKELDGKIVVKDFCFIFDGDPLFWMSTFRKIKKKRKRNCLRFNISCPSASSNEFFLWHSSTRRTCFFLVLILSGTKSFSDATTREEDEPWNRKMSRKYKKKHPKNLVLFASQPQMTLVAFNRIVYSMWQMCVHETMLKEL